MNDDKLKNILYETATLNGLNEAEYHHMLKAVDELLDRLCQTSHFMKTGEHPEEYQK